MGVIARTPSTRHALPDAHRLEAACHGKAGVLDAAIAVEDETVRRLALSEGLIECGASEMNASSATKAPAEDSARVLIHDNGQIAPTA